MPDSSITDLGCTRVLCFTQVISRGKAEDPKGCPEPQTESVRLIQIYTERCHGCGEEAGEICHRNGEMVKMIVAGFSVNGERLQLMPAVANRVLTFWGQNQNPE